MIATRPGAPQEIASEVFTRALLSLEQEPEVARLLAGCDLYAQRSRSRRNLASDFFLPLDVAVFAPPDVAEQLHRSEFMGRIRQAIDLALISPAVVSELTLWSCDTEADDQTF